jgi:hypothetical protein
MRAKNVAQKLTRNLEVSASRNKLLVLIGLAEFPGRIVEGLGDLLGGNHSPPVRERLLPLNREAQLPWRENLQLQTYEFRLDLEEFSPTWSRIGLWKYT